MRARRGVVWFAIAIAAVLACKEKRAPGPIADPTLPGTTGSAAVDAELRAVVTAKGAAYRPRTRHLDDGRPRFVNRLIRETSPYLLQHAHNPVNWYAWGDAAFARARREGKPIFLSIGYSTCHWCHVMERESFEDEEVARALNTSFVAIKVDREERPDVDQVYMNAVQVMTGEGGWPMTAILAPDGRPFFAGTYFPRKQLLAILREVEQRWRGDRDTLIAKAAEVTAAITKTTAAPGDAAVPPPSAIVDGVRMLARAFDPAWGGDGTGAKFPRPSELDLMLRYHRRTRDVAALEHVTRTLERMAMGGIRDHVGGGFHRYTTDRQWRIPHFEKMLYDNAQLAVVYLDAARAARRDDFAAVASEILDYLVRDMTGGEGGLWSATDADSLAPNGEEVEGYAFTWTTEEIAAIAGDDAVALGVYYDVVGKGELEGRHILHAPRPAGELAAALGISEAALHERLARGREALRRARSTRPSPHLDDKILAAWNGLAISAFARGALVLGREEYAGAARRAATFVLGKLRGADGRLRRSYRDGRASHVATLEDYAFVIAGLLDLFEATMEPRWLDEARALQRQVDAHYLDRAGGYFRTAADAERLLVRDKPLEDGAEPSGNAVAVRNLLRLELWTGDAAYRERAAAALAAFARDIAKRGAAMPSMLASLEMFHDRPLEIVLVAPRERAEVSPLLDVVRRAYIPNRIIATAVAGSAIETLARAVPLLDGKKALGGRPTAFVCEQRVCRRPTAEPQELAQQLAKTETLLPDRSPPALER